MVRLTTLTNSFHGTEYTLRGGPGDQVNARTFRRARLTLCPQHKYCTCGQDPVRTRDSAYGIAGDDWHGFYVVRHRQNP